MTECIFQLFFQNCLCYFWPFIFPYKLENWSIKKKRPYWGFDWDCIKNNCFCVKLEINVTEIITAKKQQL